MITFTRERLIKIQQWRETYGAGSNVVLPAEEAAEMARVMLAVIQQEPVAWIAVYHGEVYDDATGPTRSVVEAHANKYGWESALTEVKPLYTTPPAPVVPDEISPKQASRSYGGEVHGYRDGWNACRAAMLNGGKS